MAHKGEVRGRPPRVGRALHPAQRPTRLRAAPAARHRGRAPQGDGGRHARARPLRPRRRRAIAATRRSRAARRRGWRSSASRSRATTCCCSTSPPTTSTSTPPRRSSRRSTASRARSSRSPTTARSCAASTASSWWATTARSPSYPMRPARSKQSSDRAKPATRTVLPLRTTSERASRASPHYRFARGALALYGRRSPSVSAEPSELFRVCDRGDRWCR